MSIAAKYNHYNQRFRELLADYEGACHRLALLDSQIEQETKQAGEMRDRHTKLTNAIVVQKASIETMQKLVSRMAERGVKALEANLTTGLVTIFDDKNYRIKIELTDKGTTKTAEVVLVETLVSGAIRETYIRDSVGAGVQSIISLLLRVYFIISQSQRRFLVVDEGLFAVSTRYIENLFSFLDHLQAEGFVFLIVSHDPRVMAYGNSVYRVDNGTVTKES